VGVSGCDSFNVFVLLGKRDFSNHTNFVGLHIEPRQGEYWTMAIAVAAVDSTLLSSLVSNADKVQVDKLGRSVARSIECETTPDQRVAESNRNSR
jgi:alpha-D-ribose 1-methylphosphonate 5-triphosphate diphosphatase PhnM